MNQISGELEILFRQIRQIRENGNNMLGIHRANLERI